MSDADFMDRHRLSASAFTRKRTLDFATLLAFLIQNRKGSNQSELDHFFSSGLPTRHVTNSALVQARKNLSYGIGVTALGSE